MILSIGCDIVAIKRILKIVQNNGYRLLQRICTPNEIISLNILETAKHSLKSYGTVNQINTLNQSQIFSLAQFIAKRFAAKEAYAKAHGCGIGKYLSFQDIEIDNDAKGKPFFTNQTALLENLNAHLSISDEKEFAIAYVILEKN